MKSEQSDVMEGVRVAAKTRTVFDLVDLLVEVGMSDAEVLDTVSLIAQRALLEKLYAPAN